MKIELLRFDGCPNWADTQAELRDVLAKQGVDAGIELVDVTSNEQAQALRFVGSPTVRIDGRDVDPDTPGEGFGLECRIYWVDGVGTGRPPREWLGDAVRAPRRERSLGPAACIRSS